ncbi:SRPBCC family protein [Mammaliicoccus sciuri]|uniref:SRPBCC family protein n=1 Tax=Mammaliicoccus sciuri TaxID=1296 RepID=A0AAI8DLF9_MAMSC|nr:SRPBCC family protein [Mammaliicoccus sciuri]ASE35710.1 SRPBCC family protein [Mammaliicoccus sciuri]
MVKTIIIPTNIENVWSLFDLENIKRIMPQIVDMKVINKTENVVGSTYEQTYKEGKRIMKYVVTDLEYTNTSNYKHNRSGFQLGKMFDIEADYILEKINENETKFTYSGQNKGLNFIGKIMLILMPKKQNDKVIVQFID